MPVETTNSGLPAIGDIPWGTHFCQFYQGSADLADALVAFFKAGLDDNEKCVWVTSEPLGREEAVAVLRAAVPDLDRRLECGQIEVVDFDNWYTRGGGKQDAEAVLNDWIAREEQALARGYAGLRASGNTCWIETREQWQTFADYEAKVNAAFRGHRIVALCSYHLDRCCGSDALDVVRNHEFAIVHDRDEWRMVESVALRATKEELRRINEDLERRVAERTAELRESERRFRELLDALPAAVYTTDAAGRITYYNQAAVDLAGRRPVLGTDEWCVTWRLYHPDGTSLPHDECPMAVALRENRPVRGVEAIAERPDGTRVPFIPYPTPLRDASGSMIGAVNMLVDIGDRKRAEQMARESAERFRFLAESMSQKIFTATPSGAIDYFNREWMEFTGLSFDDVKNWGWLRFIHTNDVRECVRLWRHSMATGDPFQFTQRMRRVDGMFRWHLTRAQPMRDAAGRITMWIGSSTDVHEQKEAAEALRDLNDTLECKVAERTHALEAEMQERQKVEAALQQAQRLEAIGQLTGGVAHDFNNLLTVIMGQAENIIIAAGDNERVVRMANSAQRVAQRGARLTSQLLAFSRRQHLRPEVAAVDRLVAGTGDLVRRAVGEGVSVEIESDADIWSTVIDAGQFEAAILNLAVNARDAMPDGGRLTIETRNAAIAGFEARRLDLAPGDYVVVSVADTGCGMPAEVQRRCFEPFFTTKDVGKGTGLGLSQIYGFARQSGGTAAVASAVGRGTTISLYLPRAAAEPAGAAAATPEPPAAAGRGRTVLVVEDQTEVREVIEASLRQLGYRVLTAPDGIEARKVLEGDASIDLLLTDIVMPNGVNGIELGRQAQRLRQDIKVVYVSGYSRQAFSEHGAGEIAVLQKPFRQSELAATIAAALSEAERSAAE